MASCSAASLSLTLPISCQICLGKVKEPVICPNQHVFCSTCMEVWLRSNPACPTCRTEITPDRPCKKILGSLDLPIPSTDHVTRSELRQTRMELIRQDFEDEITSLQKTVERLQAENKQLYERLGEQDRQIAALELSAQQQKMKMGESQSQGKPYPDMDILVKLTSKLQEASTTYEQLKDDMNKTREENQTLREEKNRLQSENIRIKEESLFNRSPQKFGRYTVAALETKVTQYEKEIQQLKKALLRSDNYIEDLKRNECGTVNISTSQNNPPRTFVSVPGTCTLTTPTSVTDVVSTSPLNTEIPEISGIGNCRETISPQRSVKEEIPVLHCKNDSVYMETNVPVSGMKRAAGGRLNQPMTSSVGSGSSAPVSQTQNSLARLSGQAMVAPCFDIPTMVNSPSFLSEKKESWFRSSPFNRSETASDGALAQGDFYTRMSLQGSSGSPLAELNKPTCSSDDDGLKMFPASKQLRLLSEKIKRQRGELSNPLKALKSADHVELSPASSDGTSVFRALDFESEVGSMNTSESPRQSSLMEDQSHLAAETSTQSDSFPFIKIKIEVPDSDESAENHGPLKKVKTERGDDEMEA